MRPRRSASPLLPVNSLSSKHLKARTPSAQCLRLTLVCVILMVVGYAFVSHSFQSHPQPHSIGASISPVPKLTIKEQMEHRSLSGEVINTSPDPQLLHEDGSHLATALHGAHHTTHEATHHHLHEILDSPHGTDEHVHLHLHRGHRFHNHRRNHDGHQNVEHVHVNAQHDVHPDGAHQVAGHDKHPADVPDASHQVAGGRHEDAVNKNFPDATHQVAEAKGQGSEATATQKLLDDVKFIHHDKWDEKDAKAPGGDKATTTDGATKADGAKGAHEGAPVVATAVPEGTGLYALTALDIDGHLVRLRQYQGKVALVVNVASACGYTDSNYKGLQALYDKYRARGFVVLGFPCNQFGNQETGSLADIKSFCSSKYHVTFPMFSKVNVNGPETHPVYKFLRRELPEAEGGGGGTAAGKELTWNFNKFLVDPQGKPIRFFDSAFNQENLQRDIETLLLQVPKV